MLSKHGSLESVILNALWELEKNGMNLNTVKDVFEFLAKNDKEKRAYTTLKTVMDRLYEKNVLKRIKQGKKFFYKTAYSNDEVVKNSLIQIANRYCNGNYNTLSLVLNKMQSNELIRA